MPRLAEEKQPVYSTKPKECNCTAPWLDRQYGLRPHCHRCGRDRRKPV